MRRGGVRRRCEADVRKSPEVRSRGTDSLYDPTNAAGPCDGTIDIQLPALKYHSYIRQQIRSVPLAVDFAGTKRSLRANSFVMGS